MSCNPVSELHGLGETGTVLAVLVGMSRSDPAVTCYTAAFHNTRIDPYLESKGFTRGVIVFSVPALGIQFRCRAEGSQVDLEFGAFFALLRFIKTRLTDASIESIRILSSNPEFVFSFAGNSRHLDPGGERAKLLTEYGRQFKLSVGFIEPIRNKALMSPADHPSLPQSVTLALKPDHDDLKTAGFRPFQKGIRL